MDADLWLAEEETKTTADLCTHASCGHAASVDDVTLPQGVAGRGAAAAIAWWAVSARRGVRSSLMVPLDADCAEPDGGVRPLGLAGGSDLLTGHGVGVGALVRGTLTLLRPTMDALFLLLPILPTSMTASADHRHPLGPLATARLTILDPSRRMVPLVALAMKLALAFDTSSGPISAPCSTRGPEVEAWTTS